MKSLYFIILILIFFIIIFLLYNRNIIVKKINKNNLHNEHYRIKPFLNNNQNHKMSNFPIYYINMNRSVERRIFMENQFRLFCITNTNRIEAIDSNNINSFKNGTVYFVDDPPIKYSIYGKYNKKTSFKELACLLSHMKAITKAYNNGDEVAIIMEDDVSLNLMPYWEKTIKDIIIDSPDDWNMILLYNLREELITTSPFQHIGKDNLPWGAQIYIVNRKGMKVISDINYNINDINIVLVSENFLNKYLYPSYLYQKNSLFYTFNNNENMESLIHPGHTNLHIQKSLKNIENLTKNLLVENINKDNRPLFVYLRSHKGKCSFTCDYENIWGPDVEAEFLVHILGNDFQYVSIDIDDLKKIKIPIFILAYSSNIYKYSVVHNIVKITQPQILIHLSDEYGNRPEYEDVFKMVPLVYRQYRYNNYINPTNVRILPLGYHCWDQFFCKNPKPLNQRKLMWSFIGSDKNNRKEYLDILKDANLGDYFSGKTTYIENRKIFDDSIFVFCPPGNKNIECYRQYAATVNGCLPFLLCNDDVWNEVYNYFDIPPPWLHSSNMKDLIKKIRILIKNPEKLQKLQEEHLKWFNDIKNKIRQVFMSYI